MREIQRVHFASSPFVIGFSLQRKALPASMLANKAEDFEVCTTRICSAKVFS